MKILVAEDEADLLAFQARVLEKAGHEVRTAVDGVEAIEALEASPFDIAVLDLRMPRCEGIEVILEIRRRWPSCKVVAISGGGFRFGADELLVMAKAVGADLTLRKPVLGTALVEAVHAVSGHMDELPAAS